MLCCSGTWAHTAECSQAQPAWHKQWEKKQSRNRAEGVPHVCSLFMVQTHIVWPLTQYRLWSPRNSNTLLSKRDTSLQQQRQMCSVMTPKGSEPSGPQVYRYCGKQLVLTLGSNSFVKVLHKCICKTLQVAYLTSNSRWFIVHAANNVILGIQVGHGLVIQQAAAFTVNMLQMFCLRYLSAFSVILPPLLLPLSMPGGEYQNQI